MRLRFVCHLLLGLVFLVCLGQPVRADFLAGLKAYGEGEFAVARDEWIAASEAGDAMAAYRLGQMYVYGIGIERDAQAGLRALRRAAEAGLTLAQGEIGALRFEGRFVPRDYAESLKWSRAAAEAEHARSIYRLGEHHDRGLEVELDYRQALEFYNRAAELGLPAAQRRVGQFHAAGITVDRDIEQALAWFRRAAEGNEAEAQLQLALAHDNGAGVPQSIGNALVFYRQAAEGGMATAQIALGQLYMHRRTAPAEGGDLSTPIDDPVEAGLPEKPDPAEAEFWLRRAAAQGEATAKTLLGELLLDTASAQTDYFEAFELLGLARQQNSQAADIALKNRAAELPGQYAFDRIKNANEYEPAAFCMLAYVVQSWEEIGKQCGSFARFGQVVPLFVLGQVYERGLGIEPDGEQAARFYEAAGRNGYARAQNALGRQMMRGIGVARDLRQGAQWVHEAAGRGYAPAQFNLGFMYERGLGVERNPIASANWYRRAAQQGHARAQFALATHLASGVGLPENRMQAYTWLLLAETPQGTDNGEGPDLRMRAESLRRQLQASMTPAELDRSRKAAVKFRPRR